MKLRFRATSFVISFAAAVGLVAGCSPEEPRIDILGTEAKLYSQGNEELIIRDFFQDKRDGFFVDVGCAWPVRNSTTYYLEKHLQWTGIAIDALENYGPGWAKKRPRSKFESYAVTDHSGDTVTFYQHAWTGVSSLHREQAAKFGGEERLTPIEVQTITLTDLLDAHGVKKIDHLTMDIEGAEAAALAGFDIERFQPELVCIERGERYLEYFADHGYQPIEEYRLHDKVNWYFRRVR